MRVDVGDLIIYRAFDRRMGIVVRESKGFITIHWQQGDKSIIYGQNVIQDKEHTVIKP